MIIKFELFENNIDNVDDIKFKIGNFVVCKYAGSSDELLISGNIYKIIKIKDNTSGYIQLELDGVNYFWDCDRFKLATEEDILKNNTDKYNL